MQICVLRGNEAESLLNEESFASEWGELHRACPWATVFQSRAFVAAWQKTYREKYEPVLLVARGDGGELVGLLPLGCARSDGQLVPAGAHQAEYQGWICRPQVADAFPAAASDALLGEFAHSTLRFKFMPAGIPVGWAASSAAGRRCIVQASRRPVMQFGDGSHVRESLAKSGNKSRLRQLKKKGAVEFVRVTDPAEFEPLLDEIAIFHDCRQLALHGCAPFHEDRLKKQFHLAMMRTPGLLHVTTLRVGGQLASAHLNVVRGSEVQLYLIAHNPLLAHYSPGKLHMLFLARMLHEEGFKQIDLTPGGDAYKERFANAGDEVHGLAVFPTVAHRMAGTVATSAVTAAKELLRRINMTPADLRCWLGFRAVGAGEQFQPAGADVLAGENADIREDCLEHLLTYFPEQDFRSRRRFLSEALARFERGEHVFTSEAGGKVTVLGWKPPEPHDNPADHSSARHSVPGQTSPIHRSARPSKYVA